MRFPQTSAYYSTDYSSLTCPSCGREHEPPDVWPMVCQCRQKIGHDGKEYRAPDRHSPKSISYPEIDARRPGNVLRDLLRERGYSTGGGCRCGDRIATMNVKGLEWCQANAAEIAEWLQDSARHAGTLARIVAAVAPEYVAERCRSFVNEALRRAGTIDSAKVAIITTHYNPAGSERLRDTYYRWEPFMPIAPICYEMVLHGETEIERSRVMFGDDRSGMWQKERILNHAIRQLPPSVCYVAWIDHDITFRRRDWLHAGIDAVDSGADAVQLFSEIIHHDRDGKPTRSTRSALHQLATAGGIAGGAPGGAWIARRSWLDSIGGLFDQNIIGGGDTTFYEAVTQSPTDHISQQVPALARACTEYISRVGGCRWGYVRGIADHDWHGDRKDRQYTSRHDILRRHDFDPSRHLAISASGLYRWTDAAPADLVADVRQYFDDRREDG